MSKFNTPAFHNVRGRTVNMEGGVSYTRNSKKELTTLLLNSMMAGDSFYEKETDLISRIETAAKALCSIPEGAEFLAKAMIYTRTTGNMRSVSHLTAVLLSENARGFRKALARVIVRMDDMTEIVALWDSRHRGKNGRAAMPPNAMRRAFRDVLESEQFTEYHYRKYQGAARKVKLKDVVKLAHPNPGMIEDKSLFKRLINDELAPIETTMTMLSAGTNAAETGGHLMEEGKLGVMAALKNIRNALASGMNEEQVTAWCTLISDREKLHKAHVLPFRIYDAWQAVKGLPIDRFLLNRIREALDKGLSVAAENFEFIQPEERIALILDESGSMSQGKIGNRSVFTGACIMAASILSGLPKGNTVFYGFDSECRDRTDSVFVVGPLAFIDQLDACGWATCVHKPFERLIQTKTAVDKIIILTDLQLYPDTSFTGGLKSSELSRYFETYKQAVGKPNAKLMFWNLQSYAGGTPIRLNNGVMELCGYSDAMLPLIPRLWEDPDALVKAIEAVEI